MKKIDNLDINLEKTKEVLNASPKLDKEKSKELTGYPHIDKPWQQYYTTDALTAKIPQRTIYQNIYENNKDRLDETAINYYGNKITLKQFFKQIDITARAFKQMGVKEGDIVTILLPNIPQNAISVYALNKIGAIADLVDLRSKGEELQSFLDETNGKVIIASDIFLDNLKDVNDRKIVVVSPSESFPKPLKALYKIKTKSPKLKENQMTWKDFQKIGKNYPSIETQPYTPNKGACILHTGGTTGKSKSVVLTNDNFNAIVTEYSKCGLEFKEGDKLFSEMPPFLAYNILMATHLPLSLRMSVVMDAKYEPEKFVKNMLKYKPEHAVTGPVDWLNFIDKKDYLQKKNPDLSFMKTMATGGDKIDDDMKLQVNNIVKSYGGKNKVIEGYGMTEASTAVCTNLPQCYIPKSVGIPLPFMTVAIWDEDNQKFLKYNETGEIIIKGPTIMKEYLNNEKATKEVKQIHNGETWLHSGDLGKIDENGILYVVGRKKRLISSYEGFDIFPFQIEEVIKQNENVENCTVVGIPDENHTRGQVPSANIQLKEGTQNEEQVLDDIIKVCNLKFTDYTIPKRYVLVKKLPLTKAGKIDFRALEHVEDEKDNIKVLKKIK